MAGNIDVLSAIQTMERGLLFVGFPRVVQGLLTHEQAVNKFKAHYGSLPVDIAQIWFDLQTTTIPNLALTIQEKTHKGFKMFMAANYFLWSHPKNAELLSSRFGVSTRQGLVGLFQHQDLGPGLERGDAGTEGGVPGSDDDN